MHTSIIFSTLKELSQKYCLVHGMAAIIRTEDGSLAFDKNDLENIYQHVGCFEEQEIRKAFEEYECHEMEPGEYEFTALLSYTPAQIGNYPPPNVEADEYMMIEAIEYGSCNYNYKPPHTNG
jgi:hypothetical protein